MKQLSSEEFLQLCHSSGLPKRRIAEVRWAKSAGQLTFEDWRQRELLPIFDRTERRGVLLVALDDTPSTLSFELSSGIRDARTGRAKPVICDFCRTWQEGAAAASITFTSSASKLHTVTYLCCGDLLCSLHVRGLTSAARQSRAQLREDMTAEQRVERLQARIAELLAPLTQRDGKMV